MSLVKHRRKFSQPTNPPKLDIRIFSLDAEHNVEELEMQQFSPNNYTADLEHNSLDEELPQSELVSEVSYVDSPPVENDLGESLEDLGDIMCCKEFETVTEFAKYFVDGIINEAEARCTAKKTNSLRYYVQVKTSSRYNVWWLTNKYFNDEIGIHAVEAVFLIISQLDAKWLYDVRYLGKEKDPISHVYVYEICLAISTPAYPVSQATASVFFYFEVCTVNPPQCPVKVTYRLEGTRMRYKFRDDHLILKEKHLCRIIQEKISFFKKLKF